MHLGNGAITPECAALTYGAAAVGLVASAVAIRQAGVTRDKLLLAAGLGCLVFAAQAMNVPIAAGTSAHLVGGVLLAWLLGPGLGAWTMALVLAMQALALGDGGGAALGANLLNMAILPAALVEIVRRLADLQGHSLRANLALGFTAALAVPLAAALIVGETALFRPFSELTGWSYFAARMLAMHLWIGSLEGAATIAVVSLINTVAVRNRFAGVRWTLAGVACGLFLLAALTLPISSALPDGYEAAAEASGMEWLLGR
jgi:cobalt/nickel transport system permease protein